MAGVDPKINQEAARRHFGNYLRALRKQVQGRGGKHITQEEMAARVGVSPSYIGLMEAGHRNAPKADKLGQLAQGYGTTPDDLLRVIRGLENGDNDNLTAELEWAFDAVTRDPRFAFLAEPPLSLPAKFNIVQIYELSRGRQLLAAGEKAALAEILARHDLQIHDGAEMSLLAAFSREILNLLREHVHEDTIPSQKVVNAFLAAFQHGAVSKQH